MGNLVRGAGNTITATTLEWAITSPPAFHAFEGQLTVQSVNTPSCPRHYRKKGKRLLNELSLLCFYL
jgi:hypothetical protein